MIFYITVLRALASILITNAHYTGVYPIEIIANGGLLGDVLFFAVSGFCLYNIKDAFFKWYSKRIIRIYPAVWVITIIYLIIGFYKLTEMNLFELFLYPTYYHFIASIIILYIIYYFIMKNEKTKQRLSLVFGITIILQMLIYVIFYDKSYYHIDTVREPMIRFLFMEAMLLGAYFRQKNERYQNKKVKIKDYVLVMALFILYFVSKIVFSKGMFSELQLLNQYILLSLLYYIFKIFAGIDGKLEKLPQKVKKVIQFTAMITLEIYLVQYPIIPRLAWLPFPINWIAITTCIILLAYVLHKVTEILLNKIEKEKSS